MDWALAMQETCAGVIWMSAFCVAADDWASKLRKHDDIHVIMTHGSADESLSIEPAKQTHDFLHHLGARVMYVEHDGSHELGMSNIGRCRSTVQAEADPEMNPRTVQELLVNFLVNPTETIPQQAIPLCDALPQHLLRLGNELGNEMNPEDVRRM
eukprot:gene56915-biopygen8133